MNDLTMSTRKKTSEATSNLRVAVRVRPMNGTERSDKCSNIVKVDKSKNTVDLKSKPFGPFFRVYDADTTQEQIYSDLVSSQIKKVIAGFNCTVFAYGQTGTGKTFTMEGGRTDAKSSSDDPSTGIIPRAVEDIFEQLESSGCEEYSLRVSYVELYNEELFDLLASTISEDRERLRIFEDVNKKGVIVSGVEEVPVRNRSDVFKLLQLGAEKRRTAATLMNMHSSRSHSLFMVNVVVRENTHTGEELVKQGKLNLVDLAGSENIGRSGAQGNRAKEAGSINQSLLTLGRVIRSLTTNAQHVPYRESKLTRLLQDSLGGSTITSLIATMSPASSNFEESQSTLEYAMRAANIKNKPVCNSKVSKKTILKEYSDEIEKLRRDLRAAREKNGVIISQESHEEFQKNTEKCRELEQQLDYAVDGLRKFAEDFTHMDEQYKKLYDRKDQLEDRLRERIRDIAVKEKELVETNEKLDQHIQTIGLMHTAALKTYEQLLKSRDAAEEMETDIRAFWNKVDEMGEADNRNKETVDSFVKQMNLFINTISKQADSLKNEGIADSKAFVEEMKPEYQSIESVSVEITKNSEEIQSTVTSCFQKAVEIEKQATDRITKITEENHQKWDIVLKSCTDYYKAHSARSDDLNKQLVERLDEIKKQVSDFSEDVRPLLTEIRNTTCDAVEKRQEQSAANIKDVKSTCSTMAASLKVLLSQIEQLSVRAEENHEKQLISEQNTQESILSTLNTAENVIQSIEDMAEDQCDVREIDESAKSDLEGIDLDLETTVKEAREKASEREAEAKSVTNNLVVEASANRVEAMKSLYTFVESCSGNSEKCMKTKEAVEKKCGETSNKMVSLLNKYEEHSKETIQAAAAEVGKVHLEYVNPAGNVPPRIIPAYTMTAEQFSPPEPEALLGEKEDVDGSDEDELAKKKRRVTSFVRRDSLLDTTNVFLSPNAIRKRREQTIDEEEDIEN
uniref:Kinesin-like protein n=2 Tax=Caenorhabditis tropicalis TaxID=1561998 RepID=A0A1I7UXL0_9PELO